MLIGGLALLTWWRVSQKPVHVVGRPFLFSTAVYCAGRLFVDAFRDRAWVIGEGYHGLQIVALLILLVALFQIGRTVSVTPDE
jgi:prolipoprotein diacylglyceryltransferase